MKEKLLELQRKIKLTSAHTYAAYGSFFSGNMSMAKNFSDKSKASFDELENEINKILNEEVSPGAIGDVCEHKNIHTCHPGVKYCADCNTIIK